MEGGGGRTYNIYYIIHYMTLYNVYSKVKERGGGRTFYLVRTGHTDRQTHRSTYRGGAHLKKEEKNIILVKRKNE